MLSTKGTIVATTVTRMLLNSQESKPRIDRTVRYPSRLGFAGNSVFDS